MKEGSSDAPFISNYSQENMNQSNTVASSTENPVRLEVFESASKKWAKINLPKQQ